MGVAVHARKVLKHFYSVIVNEKRGKREEFLQITLKNGKFFHCLVEFPLVKAMGTELGMNIDIKIIIFKGGLKLFFGRK